MPAVSIKQRQMMAVALHHPEKLYAHNRAVLNMAKAELHKFAATKEKGLKLRAKAKENLRKKAGIKKKDGYSRIIDNKMHDYGDIDYDKKIIRINKVKSKKWTSNSEKNKAGILDSIIHEELHHSHPQMSEKRIKKLVEEQKNGMDDKQRKRYYSRFK